MPPQVNFSPAGSSEYIAKGTYRKGITGVMVMNNHSAAIGMAIYPAGSSEPLVDEPILF
jgi:hypothetical protein